MSSEENDDSRKIDVRILESDNPQVNKCLTDETLIGPCAEWNEIPCKVLDLSVNEEDTSGLDLEVDDAVDDATDNQVSDFYVIDLTCDVNDVPLDTVASTSAVVHESQALVPVSDNELARTEQKLVSLSLSILLAALLQAMHYFTRFFENFVIPQR